MNMITVHSNHRSDTVQTPNRFYTLTHKCLFDRLIEFCRCFNISLLPAEIRRVVKKVTGNEPKYLRLRMNREAEDHSGCANLSLFEAPDNPDMPDMAVYPGCVEIYCPITDADDQAGKLWLGFERMDTAGDERTRIFEVLADGFSEETRRLWMPTAMRKHGFLSNFVHQIRNPLATIITAASQIETKVNPEYNDEDRILLGFINSEAQRIENILAKYSRLSHADNMAGRDFDLAEMIRQIGRETKPADFRNITIEYDIEDSIQSLIIHGDCERINQALVELLENCLEAFRDNPGRIRISLGRDDKTAKIKIYDNGPGIRPELLRKVKEPFFYTKDGGSGLGLAIACKTVTAHGGRLTIDSDQDSNTEVCIELPCK